MAFQQLINGLTMGSIYALTAIGYTMVFGILELVNFSHGSVYMVGAFLTLTFITALRMNIIIALLLSILLTGILGIIVDKVAIAPLRKKNTPKINALIGTIGISIFLQNFVMLVFGSETKNFPMLIKNSFVSFGSYKISHMQIIIFSISVLLMIGLSLFIHSSKLGKAMRAAAQNMNASRLMGINVNRIISLTFFIGAALAAIAGALVGAYYQNVDSTMGYMAGLKAFSAAVLGGIGEIKGAMIGGLLIGVIETFAAGYINAGYRDAIAFAVLILVLVVKPSGLLGKKAFKKV
jgi:branched-chain amino acid transport system permease protein